jgi:hypothetical protein
VSGGPSPRSELALDAQSRNSRCQGTSNPFLGVDVQDRTRLEAIYEFHGTLLTEFHAAGVPMLAGTDTPRPALTPVFSLHDEIEALRDAGLAGYEALATATGNPGRLVRSYVDAGVQFGTLT